MMPELKAIRVCLDFHDRKWELPVAVGPDISRCLCGWFVEPPPVDAGVPIGVAKMLAQAMVQHATVTYPKKSGARVSFVHATNKEDVLRAFDDGYFDWTQRGQVILLSPPRSKIPAASERWLELAHEKKGLCRLREAGFSGVVLPGVDGDVAGLFTFGADLRAALLAAIETACRQAGVQFLSIAEDEFGAAWRRRSET